ncbi:MAG TPA: metal ABC transporter permease [Acidimicrobiales bacterium]|nr:metal ABC transporter permease [Acidimicrobiales bacterium]
MAAIGPGLGDMLSQPFMRHAFVAGTAVALAAGLVGYFLVLRGQVFTGDALSHVAFAGALGALALGVDARVGLFAATIVGAVAMGLLGPRGRPDDVVIGNVFAWVLGLGVFFLSLYTTSRSAADGRAAVNVLFGSILGLSASQAAWIGAVGVVACLALVAMARPLLFASVDEAVAAARGVPVRSLGLAFLAAVGACSAEATQAVGALLLLGLLAAPAGAARRMTTRPFRALWLSGAFAVVSVWTGLTASYLAPKVPPSFAIIAVAAGLYLGAFTLTRRGARGRLATGPG